MIRRSILTIILALLVSLPTLSLAGGEPCGPPLPWQTLRFEQKHLWLTARSQLDLDPLCGSEAVQRLSSHGLEGPPGRILWQLSVESSVGSSTEQMTALLRPANLHIYYKERLSKGKQQRQKDYRYSETSIQRTRRDPAPGEGERPPAQWSGVRPSTVHLTGELLNARPLTITYAILLLSSNPALRAPDGTRAMFVHTDHNIYRVELTNAGQETVKSRAQVGGRSLGGQRPTHRLSLQVTAVGEPRDKPDFDLLGLGGDISILVDAENGLPLLVRGQAPRIGKTEVHLVAAEL